MPLTRTTALTLAAASLLAGCASGFGGPIRSLGGNQYEISHTMRPSSPVKGVRQGVIDRAVEKCAKQGATYHKLREEMGTDGYLSYNLLFECQPATK